MSLIRTFAFICLLNGFTKEAISQISPEGYLKLRSGLRNSYETFTKEKKANVGFLGGSITYNPGWRDKVIHYLKEKFPNTDFHFISAGIPSLGSLPHALRLQRDLLDSGRIDLLFVEAAVNDHVNGTDSLVQLLSLEGIVRHAKASNPKMDIVIMSFADEDKTADYDKGVTPTEVANHEKISDWYSLPSINLAKEVRDKIAAKEFSWALDFKDVHPSPFGQELYFNAIKALLERGYSEDGIQSHGRSFKNLPKPILSGNLNRGVYEDIGDAILKKDWQYVADWSPDDNLDTRDGFVHVPMLVGLKPGAELEFTFRGNAVGIAVVSGADAGIVEYNIDHGAFHQADLYTKWSSFLYLPWYLLFAHDLSGKEHILTLRIKSEKNPNSLGNACRIVHFLVNK